MYIKECAQSVVFGVKGRTGLFLSFIMMLPERGNSLLPLSLSIDLFFEQTTTTATTTTTCLVVRPLLGLSVLIRMLDKAFFSHLFDLCEKEIKFQRRQVVAILLTSQRSLRSILIAILISVITLVV